MAALLLPLAQVKVLAQQAPGWPQARVDEILRDSDASLLLPLYPQMSEADFEKVVAAIYEVGA